MSLYIYYIIGTFQGMIYAGTIPLNILFAKSMDASYLEISIITITLSVVPLLTAMHLGKLIDRYGEKLPLLSGLIGMLVSLAIPFLFPIIISLFITQLILGASQTLAIIALQNGSATSVDIKYRQRSIANFSLFTSVGILLGPLLGGYLIEILGFRMTYLTFSCILILPILLANLIKGQSRLMRNQETNETESMIKILVELLKTPKMIQIIVVSGITLSVVDLFYVYFPLLGTASGLTPSQIGWIISIQGISFVGVRFIMPQIVNKIGHHYTLFGFILISALAYGAFPFFQQYVMFALLAFILGFGFGISSPITTFLAYDNAPKGRTAEVLGLRMASNRLSTNCHAAHQFFQLVW